MGLAFIIALIFSIAAGKMVQQLHQERNGLETQSLSTLLITSLLFLVARLFLAGITSGYPSDMACWSAWGQRLSQLGTVHFYSADYFCDYPPGYLYLLGGIARLVETLQLPDFIHSLFYKLPAVMSDILLFFMLYYYGNKFGNQKASRMIGILFLLTPIFWFDSSVWGQVETVLLVCLTLTLFLLSEQKYILAAITFTLSVLIKPQGLILAPVFIASVLTSKQIKTILCCLLSGIVVFLLSILPFSPAWQEYSGFPAFFHAFNPMWMIQKYMSTLAAYPYFSVNAFNFYGLLGLNWISLESINPTLVSVLNGVILLLGGVGSLFLFYKIKHPASRLFLSSYFLFGFLFTFAFKMHERYLVLPLFFLLLEFMVSKNKKIFTAFCGLGIAGFLNLFYVLQLALTTNSAPDYRLVLPISLLEVLFFLWSVWVIYREYVVGFDAYSPKIQLIPLKKWLQEKVFVFQSDAFAPTKKMTRMDVKLLSGIVLVYSIFAFVNLGDFKAPQTYYQPKPEQESFVITLEKPVMLSEINYYCGISDVEANPGIQFSYSEDGEAWSPFSRLSCIFDSVFHWESEFIEPVSVKYLQGTVQSTDYTLYEIGFRDWEGNLATIERIDGNNITLSYMADEQELVTNQPSYLNSTYFDEIYHPRTAYEHLHGLPYYETTHPPLGKLMMAAGIAIFGMTPFGWRFAGTLMGVLMLPVFYMLLKRLFRSTRYSVIGTLLFAFDFMHFSLTRLGTIDSYPVFFVLGMYYFMYRYGELAMDREHRHVTRKKELLFLFLSGLFMGLGCASKWTAVYAAAGLAVEFFVILFLVFRKFPKGEKRRFLPYFLKTCGWCLLFFVLIPATVYTLSYVPISMVDGYGNVFEAMWNNQKYMLSYHGNLNGTHPYSSPWYTWPVVYKPMWAYQAPEASVNPGQIGCISIFQNPILSWTGIVAFFYSLYLGWKKRDYRILFLFFGLLAQYIPWIFVKRYALQYHFFATMPFLILFVIYAMKYLEEKFQSGKWISSAYAILCIILFFAFYPVLSGVPVSRFYVETFLTWFDSWVFFL